MNKQSNLYTLIYITVLVLVVGTALAFTSISLKDRQQANADADKMRQILSSVNITVASDSIMQAYSRYITDSYVVNESGAKVPGEDAFAIDMASQSKVAPQSRLLPVYVCTLADGSTKYILPLYGAGLRGPIWGYVSVDADGSTVYGAYFAHQGETPGLGAEIARPYFSERFAGKHIMADHRFEPIAVVKPGMGNPDGGEYVDGISGGTITSRGVGAMLDNCLAPYAAFLNSL